MTDPDQRIDELERRLARYHEQLEAAVEQRDRFGLHATWGILKGTVSAGAFFGAIAAVNHWFPNLDWLASFGISLAAVIAALAVAGWIIDRFDRAEEDDAHKMWRLPRWGE